jgi:MarR family transcriptional regulator, lower aerobic nicotinate degradation pathway regulator
LTPIATSQAVHVRQALSELELASVRYRGRVRRQLNVNDEELSALLYLAHHGGVPQRQLGELTTLSRSGAGAMIQRLEQDGFVERQTHPDDRRVRLVELSAAGRARLRDAYADFDAMAENHLAGHAPVELDAFVTLLRELAAAAQVPLGDPDPATAASSRMGDPIWRNWS